MGTEPPRVHSLGGFFIAKNRGFMATDNKVQEPEINPVTNLPTFIPEMPVDVSDADAAEITPAKPEAPEPEKTPEPEAAFTVPESAQLPTPDPNALNNADRQRLVQLEANESEVNRQRDANQQSTEAQRIYTEEYNKWVAKGHSQQDAQDIATTFAQQQVKHDTDVNQAQTEGREQQAYLARKQVAATNIGKELGVDSQALMGQWIRDEEGMRAYALLLKDNGETHKRLGKLEEGTVEEGAPDGGMPAGSAPLKGAELARAAENIDFYDRLTEAQKKEVQTFLGV